MKNSKLTVLYFDVHDNNLQSYPVAPLPGHAPLDLKTQPAAPDYAVSEGWLVKPAAPTAPIDVFFVYPTVLFNDTDWIMDTTRRPGHACRSHGIGKYSGVCLEGQANIYAPMYRQMNLAGLSLSDADAAPLQDIVHNDVWRALTHYIKYENNGRPFFLAGHSQGFHDLDGSSS